MNVLVLTAYPPVLHMHGGGVRMFHNIRILAQEHNVRVVTYTESDQDQELLHTLDGICDSVTAVKRVLPSAHRRSSLLPFMVTEFGTADMYRVVEKEFREHKIDVLQCEYLQMAQFYRKGVLNVLTMHEAVSANAWQAFRCAADPVDKLRQFYRWRLILRYEKMVCPKFDRVVTMTEDDAEYLRSYSPQANVGAIPIGIDPAIFAPPVAEPERPVEFLFIGNFRHRPNVEAAEFLVERIAPCFPETQFVIAGSRPPDHLHSRRANVRFPGHVPDMRTLYHGTNTIVVAPLFSGTGQRVKLLEAFAMGCPVLTTTIGARGFPTKHGSRALIANTHEEYVAALRRLMGSPELRHQLGSSARRMIEQEFSWERVGGKLLDVINR